VGKVLQITTVLFVVQLTMGGKMMINETTINKLITMRFNSMAENYRLQLQDKSMSELSFDDRFGLLVDNEWDRRKNNKLLRLIKKASLKFPNACVEDIEYHSDRKLNKSQVMSLATCQYILEHHNIIIMGAAGNGKSYISCAFGVAACKHDYTTKYIRLPELLDELAIAKGEGIFQKVIKQYKRVSLLIIDEWLLTDLKGNESRDLLEIIESRHQQTSTIFCSQFSPNGWYEKIGEGTLADAILDRIVHDSYEIYIDGKISMRERYGLKK